MPEDRTPQDHGLAHPQPERGRIPQPRPRAGEDESELVPNQPTTQQETQERVGGGTDIVRQPD